MKNIYKVLIFLIVIITYIFFYNIQKLEEQHALHNKGLKFVATAYTLAEGSGTGLTKTETIPVEGRTIAVDPKVIPLGTKLIINGIDGFIAEDVGSSIKGLKIELVS